MAAGAILRAKKLSGSGIVRAAAAHNLRTIQAELGGGGPIDAIRSHLNAHLAGPGHPSAVAALAEAKMAAAGIKKLRKDAVRAVEFVVSLPASTTVDQDAFFKDALHWLAARVGGLDNVLSADIHRDEAAPHLHLLLLPLIDGRMVGSDAVGGPARLAALQSDFDREVCEPHGLKRYARRLSGHARQDAAAAVLRELRRRDDPAMQSAVWPAIRAAIDADPGAWADALGTDISSAGKPKRQRSMADIFTSPGKGPKREPDAQNHIGFAATQRRAAVPSAAGSWSHDNRSADQCPLDGYASSTHPSESAGVDPPRSLRRRPNPMLCRVRSRAGWSLAVDGADE